MEQYISQNIQRNVVHTVPIGIGSKQSYESGICGSENGECSVTAKSCQQIRSFIFGSCKCCNKLSKLIRVEA